MRQVDQLLQRDLGLKLLSVALAALLWFQATALTGPVLPQEVRDVPVQCRNLGQGLVLLSEPATVVLTVRGRADVMQRLTRDAFTAYVDLRNAGVGVGSFGVVVEGPEGVDVVRVSPGELPLEVDAWDNRQVPVQIYAVGQPAAEHAMTDQTTRPTDVYVEGPRSSVQLVSRVVARVDIAGASDDISRNVVVRPVDAEGAELSGVTVTPSTVDVEISIVKLPEPRSVQVRANVQGGPAAGYVVQDTVVSPATVLIWAGSGGEGIRYLWTHPLDIEGATGTVTRDVPLILPDGVDKVAPALVRVTVTVAEITDERKFEGLAVDAVNLAPGLVAAVDPEKVDVTVRGPLSLITSLTPQQVAVSVDLAGKGAGTHHLAVSVALPEDVSLKSVSRQVVIVAVEPE